MTRRSILATLAALTGCAKKTPVKAPEVPCDPKLFGCGEPVHEPDIARIERNTRGEIIDISVHAHSISGKLWMERL